MSRTSSKERSSISELHHAAGGRARSTSFFEIRDAPAASGIRSTVVPLHTEEMRTLVERNLPVVVTQKHPEHRHALVVHGTNPRHGTYRIMDPNAPAHAELPMEVVDTRYEAGDSLLLVVWPPGVGE